MALLSVTGSPYYINGNITYVNKKKNSAPQGEGAVNPEEKRKTREEQETRQAPLHSSYESLGEKRLSKSKEEQAKAIASRDATKKAATINISQILRDFKNTGIAIGTPAEIMDEVNTYISLVEKQVRKENPDKNLVRSNLKNGASLLDKYITETLQRQSNVVENWVDAILLQQVNYNYDEGQVNELLSVKFPKHKEEKNAEVETEKTEDNSDVNVQQATKKEVVVPQDNQLKNLFIKAKKMTYAKDYKVAMETFKEALDRAVEIKDTDTESKILYEIGNIYDKNDYLAQALTSYNYSIKKSEDLNVKAKAHYSMAQIYDDVYQFESAINHYMTTISYAGETENQVFQSASLAKIGKIFSERYEKEAFDYLSVAEDLVKETDNHKAIAFVNSNLADAHVRFNQPKQALKYYSTAVCEYDKTDSGDKAAVNYQKAAEVMQRLNNDAKAKKLLQKALIKARQSDDVQLMKDIHSQLGKMA